MPVMRTAVATAMAGLALAAVPPPAQAEGEFGPDTCRQGYVWREATPVDRVCVTPRIREETRIDNSLADARREPGGGPFGPDTCTRGHVWREATPDDRVCVTPETRAQARADNAAAASRRAPQPDCRSQGGLPTESVTPKQAVRCSGNGYWRATLTAFVHEYWFFGSDAGSSVKIEHFEDGRWVERPARVITAHNDYQARRVGEPGNGECLRSGCFVPPAPRDCRVENSAGLDCRDTAVGYPLNARAVRSTASGVFGDGQSFTMPVVIDSF
ncbi:hypothetical protein [Herbidospora mongoliensis]|uniref:hypothetical protein n=1 Tax=Herbidospora mongoliensis TaxID=688067 RepID=UPI00082E19D5|nr:hypothetical protein [Herbidospora mongoliensis]